MTQLPIPPLPPNEMIEQILEGLRELDDRFINKTIDDLIDENFDLTGVSTGFLHRGTFFTRLEPKQLRTARKVPLDPALRDRGEELYRAVKEFSNDLQYLRQGLRILLRDCETWQDYRDALPNAIKMVLPDLKHITRTREVAYTLADKPLLLDQYQALDEKLHYYLTKRLLN